MKKTKKIRFNFLAMLPGVFTALLPKLVCPMCWPIYAGLLSSLGISLSNYTRYFFPLMFVLLSVALFALGFKAKQRWGYLPLLLGVLASIMILFGKFQWHSEVTLYIGIGLLLTSSFWNSWPKRKNNLGCNACKEITKSP